MYPVAPACCIVVLSFITSKSDWQVFCVFPREYNGHLVASCASSPLIWHLTDAGSCSSNIMVRWRLFVTISEIDRKPDGNTAP